MLKPIILIAIFGLMLGGCASYTTPGVASDFATINSTPLTASDDPDINTLMSIKPAAQFPAQVVIARLQAGGYYSHSTDNGYRQQYRDFTVITADGLLNTDHIQKIRAWPQLAQTAKLNRLLLPQNAQNLADLRKSAARLRADMLLLYTLETRFKVENKTVSPLTTLSLGFFNSKNAQVQSSAAAMLVDVRTGFIYGLAEGHAKQEELTNYWNSADELDKQRLKAEQAAVDALIADLGTTWQNVVQQHQRP